MLGGFWCYNWGMFGYVLWMGKKCFIRGDLKGIVVWFEKEFCRGGNVSDNIGNGVGGLDVFGWG